MSLRRYLFALIGGLILLLTVSQLMLVTWIEQNLAEEVDVKARHLSEQVIELAFEEFDQNSTINTLIRHRVIQDNNELKYETDVIDAKTKQQLGSIDNLEIIAMEKQQSEINNGANNIANPDIVQITINDGETADAKVTKTNENTLITRRKIKRELKSLVQKIHNNNKPLNIENQDVAVFVSTPEIIREDWVEHQVMPSKTKQLIANIQIVLIICCVIALLLAYWLSVQFNKPLKLLTSGFKALAQGDYQHLVPEAGINEIRTTIQHFNVMVARLSELTQAAQHHSEIAHLAELGEVSRGLAHALRNPIHTIGLSIEQLSDEHLSRSQQTALIGTVQNKISHIDKNIKALLTLTTTGISRNDHIPVLAVVQDILLEYKSCHQKVQHFELAIDKQLELLGAESEIRSIFHTLIINACDANPANGTIMISANSKIKHLDSQQTVIITVQDQGRGLDPSVEKKIFQPHISTKPEGAGMGLYIAKRIISLHYHGDICLQNVINPLQVKRGSEASNTCTNGNNNADNHTIAAQQNGGCIATARFYLKDS